MNTPVSFELAKLLKEKGFDNINCNGYYHVCDGYTKGYAFCDTDLNNQSDNCILAPTIVEVVMWLYEKHKTWITSEPCIVHNGITNIYKIFKDNYLDTISRASKGYNSPTEAYEAAIKYILNNLILVQKNAKI